MGSLPWAWASNSPISWPVLLFQNLTQPLLPQDNRLAPLTDFLDSRKINLVIKHSDWKDKSNLKQEVIIQMTIKNIMQDKKGLFSLQLKKNKMMQK